MHSVRNRRVPRLEAEEYVGEMRERGMRESLRSLNKRHPQLVSDVSRLQVGQKVENAEYVGELSLDPVVFINLK